MNSYMYKWISVQPFFDAISQHSYVFSTISMLNTRVCGLRNSKQSLRCESDFNSIELDKLLHLPYFLLLNDENEIQTEYFVTQ